MPDEIILELKLPVPVKDLAAIADGLSKIHGKDKLFMRQTGAFLQIFKPAQPAKDPADDASGPNAAV